MAMHDREVIEELAILLRNNGVKILNQGVTLSLTSVSLNILNIGFEKLQHHDWQLNESGQGLLVPPAIDRTIHENNLHHSVMENLAFLLDFFKKIVSLKVIHGSSTIQGPVYLDEFSNLQILEIKKVPIHLVCGMQKLRPYLQSVTCSRSIQSVQDLFEFCGGDMSKAQSWPKLRSISLCSNYLETLDNSLRLVPAVNTVDVSHNMLRNTETHLEYLTHLERINLSCNRLQCVPSFSVTTKHRLCTLILSNNSLDNIKGIEELINLEELDLSENCLCLHKNIDTLCYLHQLRTLCLNNNPLSYHPNHRLLTVQHLSPVAVKQMIFDGKLISSTELMYVPKVTHHYKRDSIQIQASSYFKGHIGNHEYPPLTEILLNQWCNLTTGTDSDSVDRASKKNKRGKRKARKVDICDFDNESSSECFSSEFASSKESSRATTPASYSHLATKEQYEATRRQLGPTWLGAINVRKHQDDQVNSPNFPRRIIDVDNEDKIVHTDDDYYMNDDVNEMQIVKVVHRGSHGRRQLLVDEQRAMLELQQSEIHDEDTDGEAYIVNMDDPSYRQLIAVVGKRYLWEKDLYGQLLEKLDLKSLIAVEQYTATMTGFRGHPAIRLSFDYHKKNRQERKFIMEDHDHCLKLYAHLEPFVKFKEIEALKSDIFHCLKCQHDFHVKSRRNFRQKNLDVSVCPQCDSTMIIEMSPKVIQSPEAGDTTPIGSMKSNGLQPVNLSFALTSPEKLKEVSEASTFMDSFKSITDTTAASSYKSLSADASMAFSTPVDSSMYSSNSSAKNSSLTEPLVECPDSNKFNQLTFISVDCLKSATYAVSTMGGVISNNVYSSTPKSTESADSCAIGTMASDSRGDDTIVATRGDDTNVATNRKMSQGFCTSNLKGHQDKRFNSDIYSSSQYNMLNSEESDIAVLSDPSQNTKANPKSKDDRDERCELSGLDHINYSSPIPKSKSLDEGETPLCDIRENIRESIIDDLKSAEAHSSHVASLNSKALSSMIESVYENSINRKNSSESSFYDKFVDKQESDIYIVKRVKPRRADKDKTVGKRSGFYETIFDNSNSGSVSNQCDDSKISPKSFSHNPFDNDVISNTKTLEKDRDTDGYLNPFGDPDSFDDDSHNTILRIKALDSKDSSYNGNQLNKNTLESSANNSKKSYSSAAFPEGENPFSSEILVNMIDDVKMMSFQAPSDIDTSFMKYNYLDFSQVDYRLSLWMSMKLFTDQYEECQALLRCGVVQYMVEVEFQGLLITSNKKVYVAKITGAERLVILI